MEEQPDPRDLDFLETQIRSEASAFMGLGDEVGPLAVAFAGDRGRFGRASGSGRWG